MSIPFFILAKLPPVVIVRFASLAAAYQFSRTNSAVQPGSVSHETGLWSIVIRSTRTNGWYITVIERKEDGPGN
jgi:hypothetical protein